MPAVANDDLTDLNRAATALTHGQLDDGIAMLEAMADRGLATTSVCFDRGLAYALRARSGHGMPGDFGRAVHAFEEVLRRDPHDAEARAALEEVRREIASRDAMLTGKGEQLGAPPLSRSILVAVPGSAWTGLALTGSMLLTLALAARPRFTRPYRLYVSAVVVTGAVFLSLFGAAALGAWHLRHTLVEGVVVAPKAVATSVRGDGTFDLYEGARVDVLEQRATSMRVATDRAEGWIPREAVRLLPSYRP